MPGLILLFVFLVPERPQEFQRAGLARLGAGVAASLLDAQVPVLQFQVTPPEDLSAFAQTLKELHGAGLDADPEEIGKRFGLHLERKEDNV